MQNNEYNIDQLFSKKLTNFEIEPSPNVWENISASMGYSKRKRRMFLIWTMAGAASLVFAFLLGWYLSDNTTTDEQLMAKIENYKNTVQQAAPISSPMNQTVTINFEKTLPEKIINTTHIQEKHAINTREINFLAELNRKNVKSVEGKKMNASLVKINNDEFSALDRALIEANLLAVNSPKNKNENSAWSVGIQASPVYRFDALQLSSSSNMDFASNNVDSRMNMNNIPSDYQANISGGISVAYNTGNRLSIITGINYDAVSQKAGNIAIAYAGNNALYDRNHLDYEISASPGLTDKNSIANNVVLNTDMGFANIQLPEGTPTSPSFKLASAAPELVQNYDYAQDARYIEIPLLLRYKLIDHKIGLHILGGINTNLLVDNSVQLSRQNNVIANGTIEGLRPYTFSSSLGMGMNYAISNRFNFNFEPTLKINLNTLNAQQSFNVRPYAFGIYSGFSYLF